MLQLAVVAETVSRCNMEKRFDGYPYIVKLLYNIYQYGDILQWVFLNVPREDWRYSFKYAGNEKELVTVYFKDPELATAFALRF